MGGLFARFRLGLLFWGVLGVCGLAAIIFLAVGVVQDLRLLSSARSDNVQWSLSQTEVEFLEFERELAKPNSLTDPQLTVLRREFDIFYSRINTISESVTYQELRTIDDFSAYLAQIQDFLRTGAKVIDNPKAASSSEKTALKSATSDVRGKVRALSNSGLNFFATESDRIREGVTGTFLAMAIVVAVLLTALGLGTIYLTRLFLISNRRRNDAVHANDRMNVVIGSSLDAVIVADDFGNILDFNPAAETIFGHKAKDVIGGNLAEVIIPDHFKKAHADGMKRMRDNGEKRVVGQGRVQLEAKRADGSHFPVELAIQTSDTPEGQIFVAFLRDLTQQVAAGEELIQARDRAVAGEKAKTDFMATMSHEIRTPLNGLLGNLSLLEDTELDPAQRKFTTHMRTSGRLLLSHISDVLDITKYDAGKLDLRPAPMDLTQLIQDIVDNQSSAAIANMTSLKWAWKGAPVDWINADRERLQHILMNLIGNAVKFTEKGAVMIVPELQKDGQVLITVRDTGVGISEDIRAHIFDDFVTGNTAYDRQVGGTGLGLGIARRFITALGGTIGVESQLGQGSQFWIKFPVQIIDTPNDQNAEHIETPELECRVLLVEDNEINRFVAHEMLKANGHSVVEATDGQAGVNVAQDTRFDLILMDISMPVMDGRAATKAIRTGQGLCKDVPIIALTANAMASEQEAFLEDGMNAILTKPLSRSALQETIQKFVHKNTPIVNLKNVPQDLSEIMATADLTKLLLRFDAEGQSFLDWLSTADPNDTSAIQQESHKIAGTAAIFGPPELRKALVDLEIAAKANNQDAVATASKALIDVWQVTRPIQKDV